MEKFKPLKYYSDQKIVLLPSRIVKSKGILEFIEAAKLLKGQSRFIICGDFDLEAKDKISVKIIEKNIREKNIEFWGFKKNMADIYKYCSIVVLPSIERVYQKHYVKQVLVGKQLLLQMFLDVKMQS